MDDDELETLFNKPLTWSPNIIAQHVRVCLKRNVHVVTFPGISTRLRNYKSKVTMSNYVTPQALSESIRQSQQLNSLTPDLVRFATLICDGIAKKMRIPDDAKDDLRQECLLLLMRKIHHLKPDQNCFAYISQLMRNDMSRNGFRKMQYEKLLHNTAKHMGLKTGPWQDKYE